MFRYFQKWSLVWMEEKHWTHSTKEKYNTSINTEQMFKRNHISVYGCFPLFFFFYYCALLRSLVQQKSPVGGMLALWEGGNKFKGERGSETPGLSKQRELGGCSSPAEPGSAAGAGKKQPGHRNNQENSPGTVQSLLQLTKSLSWLQSSLKATTTCRGTRGSEKFVDLLSPYVYSLSLWTSCFPDNSLSS